MGNRKRHLLEITVLIGLPQSEYEEGGKPTYGDDDIFHEIVKRELVNKCDADEKELLILQPKRWRKALRGIATQLNQERKSLLEQRSTGKNKQLLKRNQRAMRTVEKQLRTLGMMLREE